jgi:hypothetical protein
MTLLLSMIWLNLPNFSKFYEQAGNTAQKNQQFALKEKATDQQSIIRCYNIPKLEKVS